MTPSERCPHCRANVGVRAGRDGRQRCRICGGPRVQVRDSALALSGDEVPHLVEARRHQRGSWLWMGGAFLAAAVASVFLLLVTLGVLFFDPQAPTTLALLLLTSFPFLGAFWAYRRSRTARGQAESAHRQAQLSAARDVLTGSARALTAQRVAHSLDLPLATTEGLLAELNADEAVASEVTETGDITYRLAPLRARVELDDDFEAALRGEALRGEALRGEALRGEALRGDDDLDAPPGDASQRTRRSGPEPSQS